MTEYRAKIEEIRTRHPVKMWIALAVLLVLLGVVQWAGAFQEDYTFSDSVMTDWPRASAYTGTCVGGYSDLIGMMSSWTQNYCEEDEGSTYWAFTIPLAATHHVLWYETGVTPNMSNHICLIYPINEGRWEFSYDGSNINAYRNGTYYTSVSCAGKIPWRMAISRNGAMYIEDVTFGNDGDVPEIFIGTTPYMVYRKGYF